MAHFAKIENNIVTQVIVFDNNGFNVDEQGNESEAVGTQVCTDLLGGDWKQTSYNNNIRKNYAGVGYTYDESRDAFIAPQPFPSWVLYEDTCQWESPVPYPDGLLEGEVFEWNEETQTWDLSIIE
jgi:hypothetical protein